MRVKKIRGKRKERREGEDVAPYVVWGKGGGLAGGVNGHVIVGLGDVDGLDERLYAVQLLLSVPGNGPEKGGRQKGKRKKKNENSCLYNFCYGSSHKLREPRTHG